MRALFVFLIIVFVFIVFIAGCKTSDVAVKEKECSQDADCVPAGCCHANSCVAASKAPSCDGIYCSMECAPGTLDCGAGNCICQDGKCGVRWIGE